MKIAIDISQIIYGTGVSAYTRNLVGNLLKVDRENEYILFGGSLRRLGELKAVAAGFKGRVSDKIFPLPPVLADLIWNRLHILPIEKFIGEVGIFHSSDWSEPPSKAPKVTTIHDLYAFKFPRLLAGNVLSAHRRKLSWVLEESKRVIVPSESTKKDLVGLGMNGGIIRVIPEAPSLSEASPEEVSEAKRKYGLQGDYLISIGATPLKNTERIIKAFQLAKVGHEVKLVIVGRPVNVRVEAERNIRILGHVLQSDLAPLLTGSRGLVFASLYEGYGIPILDAFACGVPVVTSNTASMPEVAGDAAVLVDPTDINSIADGIVKILKGPKGLVDKGRERVKRFSWEKTAEMTLDVYNELK
ncbi:MAG: Glycosyl transferase group 1 [Candidatus Woesebacteria bacterium GW2011_GWB1_45_5]|uniref:Glycosyl transferase group 1 n=1 Tax=Candidatus Woesebacteria bacterium GW2011_GWB1_45_5 TaxID=1618581 RepID=A0A0G1PYL2_9BACT|nr:MAG: Glycosyl transferase group 1 [Candidatus Woesebacteria bacterium GW2011_GWB1_45_5]